MKQVVLIIGNGFDLDLGLPTKYSDFANSKNQEWIDFIDLTGTVNKQTYLTKFVDHMLNARLYENWFDIEEEIFKFACTHENVPQTQIGLIKYQFETLVERLRLYINRVAQPQNKKDGSLAEVLLNNLNLTNRPVEIYTFNYTDCFYVSGIKKNSNINLRHLHGSLSYDMTLGGRTYGDFKMNEKLDFMYKPTVGIWQDILRQNLESASEVIVFGHSLNIFDFCYFKDFLNVVVSGNQSCKHLTIICKDEKSENDIKHNIDEVKRIFESDICFSKLANNIEIRFIYTDLWKLKDPFTVSQFKELCSRMNY